MTWARAAARYLATFESARQRPAKAAVPVDQLMISGDGDAPPKMRLGHLLSMCDDTGLFQHAVHSVPNRAHGYCVDDNARALLLACALNDPSEQRLPEALTARLAAFVQHAWNPDTKRFRNFMSFDRRWLEDSGSEDSHGRTLWALGECARGDASPSRRRWASALFADALPATESFKSPRAWAFTLLGLDAYCAVVAQDPAAEHLRHLLAGRLLSSLSSVATKDWIWFEDGLAYDNARLSQALIATGTSTKTPAYVEAGLRSLRWLMTVQTSPSGFFRPVGTDSFGDRRKPPRLFDQQPLEATATISACLAAWRAEGDIAWRADAALAFAWFLGGNDLSLSLVDPETGSCRDGLHRDRTNENKGGESVVSYLLALSEIRQVAHLNASGKKFAARLRDDVKSLQSTQMNRGRLVRSHIPEPAGSIPAPRSGESRRPPVQAGD
jgi:hypothetical protein